MPKKYTKEGYASAAKPKGKAKGKAKAKPKGKTHRMPNGKLMKGSSHPKPKGKGK
jgi:hypothetical protein